MGRHSSENISCLIFICVKIYSCKFVGFCFKAENIFTTKQSLIAVFIYLQQALLLCGLVQIHLTLSSVSLLVIAKQSQTWRTRREADNYLISWIQSCFPTSLHTFPFSLYILIPFTVIFDVSFYFQCVVTLCITCIFNYYYHCFLMNLTLRQCTSGFVLFYL